MKQRLKNEERRRKQKQIKTINPDDYLDKLDKLLNRVSIQNKFSNRVLESNISNITRRQKAQQQLEKLYQIRKQQEINEVQLKNLNSQLSDKLKNTQIKLNKTIIELLEARKKIKLLNKQISQLQEQNLELQVDGIKSQRSKVDQLFAYKLKVQDQFLQTQIQKYLENNSQERNHRLFAFCKECFKNNDYQNFFERLEESLAKFPTFKSIERSGRYSIDNNDKPKYFPRTIIKTHRKVKTLAPLEQV